MNPAEKRSKYRARKEVVDGITFASGQEASYYRVLRARAAAGEIEDLVLQPRYPVQINGILVCTYVADFRYWDVARGEVVVCDVKGFRTPVYKLKKKAVQAEYGIVIEEVTRGACHTDRRAGAAGAPDTARAAGAAAAGAAGAVPAGAGDAEGAAAGGPRARGRDGGAGR